MKPTCLYRPGLMPPEELEAAAKYFSLTPYPGQVPANQIVLSRYASLPFYELVEGELALVGSRLLNKFSEHQFIADALCWSGIGAVLEKAGLTPWSRETWYGLPEGSYVLKGKTNSRKGAWSRSMFCRTVADIPAVVGHLLDDEMIAQQGLIIRPYVPLVTFDTGINGQPVTAEYRSFWYRDPNYPNMEPVQVARGYYWSSWPEYEEQANSLWDGEADRIVHQAARLISPYVPFFVLDMALTQAGNWIVIECNDGSQSGLSMIDPEAFYKKMAGLMVSVP